MMYPMADFTNAYNSEILLWTVKSIGLHYRVTGYTFTNNAARLNVDDLRDMIGCKGEAFLRI